MDITSALNSSEKQKKKLTSVVTYVEDKSLSDLTCKKKIKSLISIQNRDSFLNCDVKIYFEYLNYKMACIF